jgi:hypothetical protein
MLLATVPITLGVDRPEARSSCMTGCIRSSQEGPAREAGRPQFGVEAPALPGVEADVESQNGLQRRLLCEHARGLR